MDYYWVNKSQIFSLFFPITTEIKLKIKITKIQDNSNNELRFNFAKANWACFGRLLDIEAKNN